MTLLRLAFLVALTVPFTVGCGSDATEFGTGGTGGTTFEPGETCVAFCANLIGVCQAFPLDEPGCGSSCQALVEEGRAASEDCATAYENGFSCVAEQSCVDVVAWVNQLENPCSPFIDVIAQLCPP